MLPSQYVNLDRREKAVIIAMIDIKIAKDKKDIKDAENKRKKDNFVV
jgi:hypothetical protein